MKNHKPLKTGLTFEEIKENLDSAFGGLAKAFGHTGKDIHRFTEAVNKTKD